MASLLSKAILSTCPCSFHTQTPIGHAWFYLLQPNFQLLRNPCCSSFKFYFNNIISPVFCHHPVPSHHLFFLGFCNNLHPLTSNLFFHKPHPLQDNIKIKEEYSLVVKKRTESEYTPPGIESLLCPLLGAWLCKVT